MRFVIFIQRFDTYLFLLLIEIVNDYTNKEVEREKGSKYDENNKIQVHLQVDFILWLFVVLQLQHIKNQLGNNCSYFSFWYLKL